MGDALTILHLSDLHLGSQHDATGRAEERRRAVFRTSMAIGRLRADLVIVAGDFFDSARVSDESVDFAVSTFESADKPVVLLPGNHDALGPASPYDRPAFHGGGPANVHVLRAREGEERTFPDLDTEIWGRAHHQNEDFGPLKGAPTSSRNGFRWRLGVAHGHLVRGGGDLHRSWTITVADIESAGFDYLALGHWDHPWAVSGTGQQARYSGGLAPAPGMDRDYGHALLVTLSSSGISFSQLTIQDDRARAPSPQE